MKKSLKPRMQISHAFRVDDTMFPEFQSRTVHRVCSTYHLVQEVEWTSRQLILDVLEEDEEGIGTRVTIDHLAPAVPGDEVVIMAVVQSFDGKELMCSYEARVKNRVVARGETGQKIVKKEKLIRLLSSLDS